VVTYKNIFSVLLKLQTRAKINQSNV